jgi:hypothetical protein
MKSITVKSNLKKAQVTNARSTKKNKKSSPTRSAFRFAPDAIGIMKGPADLSMREGFSK